MILLIVLVAFAGFCLYHYRKPFGLSSPLRITNHYNTNINGEDYEMILVAWRTWYGFLWKPVRNEHTLRSAWHKAGYASASAEDRCALFNTPNFVLPIGLYLSSDIKGGRLVAMVLVGGQHPGDNSTFLDSQFSFSDVDRYVLVPLDYVRSKPLIKSMHPRTT